MAGLKQRLQQLRSVIVQGYSLPVVFSLALHGVLLILVFVGWERTSQKRIVPPAHIVASLVEQPQAKPQPQPQPPKPAVDREAQRRAEQQRVAEQKRQEEARQAEARRQEQQRQKELALKREKEKQEQARREEEARKARELEQQRQREAERKKQLEEDRRKQQEMLKRLEQERLEQEMMAQAQAEHDQQQVAKYSALIKSLASDRWNRPPSARNNMVAEVRISLSPFGDLLDVTLIQSSGNEPFDRSVEQAIRNAAPFRELRDLERRIFDEYFRQFTIRFRPEDLVR